MRVQSPNRAVQSPNWENIRDISAPITPTAEPEPCDDVIVSAAARWSILVGGSAPPVPKNRRRPKIFFKKISEIFVLSSKFFNDLF